MKNVIEVKPFRNGGSNAVRIPASFKIENGVVYMTMDEVTGDITISSRSPKPFAKLLALLDQTGPISEAEWKLERDNEVEPIRKSIQDLIAPK
ncbi:MAG: hypothetical protein ACKOWH_01875 [Rhodoluna sp.]